MPASLVHSLGLRRPPFTIVAYVAIDVALVLWVVFATTTDERRRRAVVVLLVLLVLLLFLILRSRIAWLVLVASELVSIPVVFVSGLGAEWVLLKVAALALLLAPSTRRHLRRSRSWRRLAARVPVIR